MEEKKKRNMHPNSLANLRKGRKFTSEDGYAQKCKVESNVSRLRHKDMEKIAKAHLDEIAEAVFSEMGLRDFAKLSAEGKNQAVRIAARQLADQKTAWPALVWFFEQYLGRPRQKVEQEIDGGLTVNKPGVVFRHDKEQGEEE